MGNKEFTMEIDLRDIANSQWGHRLLYLYRYGNEHGREFISNCLHELVLENPNFKHSNN